MNETRNESHHMTIATRFGSKARPKGKSKGKLKLCEKCCSIWAASIWESPDAATLQTLQSISDAARLSRMSKVLLDLQSWNELLAVM